MNKNDIQSEILQFETEIDEDGNIHYSQEEFRKLKQVGFEKVTIKIFGLSKKAARSLNFDSELFETIKEKQGLPESVVLEFLNSKGSIKSETLKNKLTNISY